MNSCLYFKGSYGAPAVSYGAPAASYGAPVASYGAPAGLSSGGSLGAAVVAGPVLGGSSSGGSLGGVIGGGGHSSHEVGGAVLPAYAGGSLGSIGGGYGGSSGGSGLVAGGVGLGGGYADDRGYASSISRAKVQLAPFSQSQPNTLPWVPAQSLRGASKGPANYAKVSGVPATQSVKPKQVPGPEVCQS
jgi:hypothetical protein